MYVRRPLACHQCLTHGAAYASPPTPTRGRLRGPALCMGSFHSRSALRGLARSAWFGLPHPQPKKALHFTTLRYTTLHPPSLRSLRAVPGLPSASSRFGLVRLRPLPFGAAPLRACLRGLAVRPCAGCAMPAPGACGQEIARKPLFVLYASGGRGLYFGFMASPSSQNTNPFPLRSATFRYVRAFLGWGPLRFRSPAPRLPRLALCGPPSPPDPKKWMDDVLSCRFVMQFSPNHSFFLGVAYFLLLAYCQCITGANLATAARGREFFFVYVKKSQYLCRRKIDKL